MLTSNHLYLIFASPALYKHDVPADQSLNVTHLLAKRVYYPPDQLCNSPDDWAVRRCIYPVSDRLWWDLCLYVTANGTPFVYIRPGACDIGKMCFNMLVDNQDLEFPGTAPTSMCIDRPKLSSVIDISPDGIKVQSGVVAVAGSADPQRTMSIQVLSDIPKASVSGFIEGTNNAITPGVNIFGSMSGTSLTLSACDWNSTNFVCAPTGRDYISAFASVIFTFTFLPYQKGNFYYAVVGS